MTEVVFKDSDLTGTIYSRTNLEKADFRDAINIAIDPEGVFRSKRYFLIYKI